jgi:hypothetical protein
MEQPSDWIDGKFLVLPTRTALPQRCVRTNRPVSERDYRVLDLPYLPRGLRIVMCLVPAFLLFAPFVVRNRCRVQAGISRQVRNRYLLRKLVAGMLISGSLITPFVLIALNRPDAAMVMASLFPLLFWGGFILLLLFGSPLTIQRRAGEHYWLDGCSAEFLKSLGVLGEESPGPSIPPMPANPAGS